jgi:glycerol kinase
LQAGVWRDLDALRKLSQTGTRFQPTWDETRREKKLIQWRRAVQAAIEFYSS